MNFNKDLLKDLKDLDPEKRKQATKALWSLWHCEAGEIAKLRLSQGISKMNSKKFSQAEQIFVKLIADFPKFAEAHNKLATLLYLQKKYLESILECKMVVSLNSHHFGAWNGMGLCFFNLGKYSEAIESFQSALEIQPFAEINRIYIAKCLGNLN